MNPRALIVGPLPPPPGGVGRLVEAILASPLAERWTLGVFDLSKPQQEGKPSTITAWDLAWTLVHLVTLPLRLLKARPRVALVQSTADTGFVRDLALILILRAFRVPVVIHWHGAPDSAQFPGPDPASWRSALFRFAVRRARGLILLAEPYRPFFAQHVEAGRLLVVPNFVDGAAIEASAPAGATSSTTALRLVFLGRVGPQKGVDVLLDAFARARESMPGLALELIGEGESPRALEAVRRHPAVVAGHVVLTGALGHERFARLRAADVFVLPTRADSFPLSILEAMAAGLPVVASSVGAIPWLLDDGACGALVSVDDAAALATSLLHLAQHPEQRAALGQAARARQRALFDSAHAAARLDTILRVAARIEA
jgi:glycosyltransferase involved in cell wall biosynthesis